MLLLSSFRCAALDPQRLTPQLVGHKISPKTLPHVHLDSKGKSLLGVAFFHNASIHFGHSSPQAAPQGTPWKHLWKLEKPRVVMTKAFTRAK